MLVGVWMVVAVLNNDSVEFTEEYCPSDVMQTLYQRGWVISPEEQVGQISMSSVLLLTYKFFLDL